MNTTSNFDYSFKFILVGDTGVGKTSLISRFVDNKFDINHQFTVGVEFGSRNITINGKIIKLQIWDTAGQQQFKAITRSYYRSSAAALVVFDITRKDTFRNVVRWVEDVKNNSNKDVILVLVGNKTDLTQQRMVSRDEALKLARDYQMLYLQTSAKISKMYSELSLGQLQRYLIKLREGLLVQSDKIKPLKLMNHLSQQMNRRIANVE